jgi:Tetratricopeptide repeat/Leucine Rich repeat
MDGTYRDSLTFRAQGSRVSLWLALAACLLQFGCRAPRQAHLRPTHRGRPHTVASARGEFPSDRSTQPTDGTAVAAVDEPAAVTEPTSPASDLADWSVEPLTDATDSTDEVTQTADVWEEFLSSEEALSWLDGVGATVARDYDDNTVTDVDFAFLRVADNHLPVLRFFPDLRELDLTGTDVSDVGLAVFADLPALEALKLRGTSVSDAGLLQIAQLQQLQILDLSRTNVTDDGISTLSHLPQLRYLLLNHTQVSDAGLRLLSEMDSLRGINLIGTNATVEGVSRLQALLPECVIISATNEDLSAVRPPETFRPAMMLTAATGDAHDSQISQFQHLVELANQQPDLAEHLATVCVNNDRWSEAAAILEAAVVQHPDDAELTYQLAEALVHTGRRQDAVEAIRPVMGEAAANHAIGAMVFRKALVSAEHLLQKSLELEPNNSQARRQMQLVRTQLRWQTQAGDSPVVAQTADWELNVQPGNHDVEGTQIEGPRHSREPQLPTWQQARSLPANWFNGALPPSPWPSVSVAPGYPRQ